MLTLELIANNIWGQLLIASAALLVGLLAYLMYLCHKDGVL